MLTENKISKYLIYAIGEILLVVIGILIALSINNWNSSNIENKEVKDFLERLKIEYSSNVQRAELVLEKHTYHPLDKQIEIIDDAISSFQNGINQQNYNSIMRSDLFWYTQFNMRRNVSQEGIISGLLFKVENQNLIDMIQRQKATMEGRQIWVDKMHGNYKSVYTKAINFRFIRPHSEFTRDTIIVSTLESNPWLLQEKEESYQLAFLSITSFKEFLIARRGYLISEIKGNTELISLINEELKK